VDPSDLSRLIALFFFLVLFCLGTFFQFKKKKIVDKFSLFYEDISQWIYLVIPVVFITFILALIFQELNLNFSLLIILLILVLGVLFLLRQLIIRFAARKIADVENDSETIFGQEQSKNSQGNISTQIINEADEEKEEQEDLIETQSGDVIDKIDQREKDMIKSILKLDRVTARDIMTPRIEILAVEINSEAAKIAQLMVAEGHTKVPVYSETIDNIEGVIYAQDLLDVLAKGNTTLSIKGLLRSPYFVPESKFIDELLEELQEKKIQLALVVDEYGGIEGLVTMEDILEEIVGEIDDDFSKEEPKLHVLNKYEANVDARIHLDDINQHFGTNLIPNGIDSIGGLVFSILDRIPKVGDKISIENLHIEVVSTRAKRILQLHIRKEKNKKEDE